MGFSLHRIPLLQRSYLRLYVYYFRATSMAPMCLVRITPCCYRADSEVDPPLKDRKTGLDSGGDL